MPAVGQWDFSGSVSRDESGARAQSRGSTVLFQRGPGTPAVPPSTCPYSQLRGLVPARFPRLCTREPDASLGYPLGPAQSGSDMSLTSFLDLPDVRQRLAEAFEKPRIKLDAPMLAAPLSGRASLVGTAFDYLFRFAVLKANGQRSSARQWVARGGLARTPPELQREGSLRLKKATTAYRRFAVSDEPLPGPGLVDAAMGLAQLDVVFRAGVADFELPPEERQSVGQDLANLLAVIPMKQFRANSICLANPTFGDGSRLVGGGDADLLLDGTLLEVKTVKKLALDRSFFNQLIGYVCLARLGGVDGCPPGLRRIESIGVYFSRFGLLHTFPLSAVPGIEKLPEFLVWFRKRAKEEFGLGAGAIG